MARQANANYQFSADTQFEWATADADPFDRELDLYRLAKAIDLHDHSSSLGLPVARIATNVVGATNLQSNAVTTAKIADGQVTTSKLAAGAVTATAIADGTITNAKLAAGVAVANLGYTPINKAGDTGIGSLSFASGANLTGTGTITFSRTTGVAGDFRTGDSNTVALIAHNTNIAPGYGLGVVNQAGSGYDLLVDHNQASFGVMVVGTRFLTTVSTGTAPFSTSSTTLCTNLNANYLNGQPGSYYGRATNEAPSGVIAGFFTAAAIASGWSRVSAADGRIIIASGTSFSVTYSENAQSGSSWSHNHSASGLSGSVSGNTGGPSETFPVAGGGIQVASAGHVHGGSSLSVSISGGTISSTSWSFPAFSYVLASKS